TTDGDHGVDRFDTRLQRFFNGLTENYTGGFPFQGHFIQVASDGAFTVDWFTQGVYHAANHSFTYANRCDLSGPANFSAFFDIAAVTHEYHTHVIFFKVERDCANAVLKLYQFTVTHIAQSIHASDTVAHLQYGAN